MTWDLCMEEFRSRGIVHVERYMPIYLASIGAHMLNLANKRKQFFTVLGKVFDFRVHAFLVAPPGYGKSFFLDHFLDHETMGILVDTAIPTEFSGYLTEAGWVGQVIRVDGEPVPSYGLAYEYATGIVGCEEFEAIAKMMRQRNHGEQLDVALLTSLDRGRVRKRVGPGWIKYETFVTLWAGTQDLRLDLSSGMGRRLTFMTFFPTEHDRKLLQEAFIRGENVSGSLSRVLKIRKEINERYEQVQQIEHIEFSSRFYDLMRRWQIIHYEIPIYQRLLAGYHVLKYPIQKRLYIDLDDTVLPILQNEVKWRQQIARGGNIAQVIEILRDNNKRMKLNELRDALTKVGMNWIQSSEVIERMVKMKIVKYESGEVVLPW